MTKRECDVCQGRPVPVRNWGRGGWSTQKARKCPICGGTPRRHARRWS